MGEERAIAKKENGKTDGLAPFFVEAEKLFEDFAETSKKIAQRAFEYFESRGGMFGRELDDWFRAEAELLRMTPVEMTEDEKNIMIMADVAGFKPEEIEISVLPNELLIKGKTEAETKKEEEKTILHEWKSNHFFRRLPLPIDVDAKKAEANLKDGVLRLTLPKAPDRSAVNVSVQAN